jgi:uncharacterized protein with PQ loop repeat
MDKQQFSFYRKNTIYLFVIAALLMAVSVLATVLVLVPAHMLINDSPILLTVLLWIALLFGTILGESRQISLFNMVVSIMGFICSFVLAVSMFAEGDSNALSLFLFWISQILSAVFILSSYFSIQAYLETKKTTPIKKAPRTPRKKKVITTR